MAAAAGWVIQSRTWPYTVASSCNWLCCRHAVWVLRAPPLSRALSRGLMTSSHGDHHVPYRGVPHDSSVELSAVKKVDPGVISLHAVCKQKMAVFVPWLAPASDTSAATFASAPVTLRM